MITTEEVNEITDMLENKADIELQKANAYCDGYVQACEDFRRSISLKMIEKQTEEAGDEVKACKSL